MWIPEPGKSRASHTCDADTYQSCTKLTISTLAVSALKLESCAGSGREQLPLVLSVVSYPRPRAQTVHTRTCVTP